MFDLSVEELTWKIVGQWTTKETELDYSIIAKHQPMSRMDTMIGSSFSPYGKPYRVSIMYFLNGSQLFIATLRCDTEDKDFESKTMIDLSACALMTEPVIDRRSPGFLSATNRASYWGEKFFYLNSSSSQTLQEGGGESIRTQAPTTRSSAGIARTGSAPIATHGSASRTIA